MAAVQSRPRRIEDYALIGDGETAALVGRDGSIDWLCLPRFDSDACFARLLGDQENGFWRIAPDAPRSLAGRRYEDGTLVLETLFESRSGQLAVLDFMPIRQEHPVLIRIVEGRAGRMRMRSELALRFDYGRIHPRADATEHHRIELVAGPHAVSFHCPVATREHARVLESRFTVAAGERVAFVMAWRPSHLPPRDVVVAEEALETTRARWRGWIAGARCPALQHERVRRSLITLKAMVHGATGGVVAAPTASLPERIGGARNWDYRYCWLRDATFTLLALIHAGLGEEARAWIGWLRRTVAGEPAELQPFYTVDGGRRALEWEADWLRGFENSRPVRFGNGAGGQLQLDIYGEVIDALYVSARNGVHDGEGALIGALADRLKQIWREPDAGIWESRGPACHHTYSKAMCWVGFDRAARWFQDRDPRRAAGYRRLADRVHAQVLKRGFDRRRGSFVRAFDDHALDASTLRLALVGFLPPDDPRIVGTVAAAERELMPDGLVLRYRPGATDDGVGGREGAFIAASFWLADVYVLQGRMEDGRRLFDCVCSLANDVGLLSEEAGADGRLLGNFPQALSHLSLVNTALNLGTGGGPAHERASRREQARASA